MAEKTPEEQIQIHKSNARFWRNLLLGVLIVPNLLTCGARKANEAVQENTTFGEKTTFTGGVLRKLFLTKCGDNCSTTAELLAAKDDRPREKFAGDTLRYISTDPVTKSLVAQVAARGVVFDGDPEYFKSASTCSAGGTYTPTYGSINYTVGEVTGIEGIRSLGNIFNHELFHANQKLEGKRFPTNSKDQMIYTLALEAAAYTFGDIMSARQLRLEKPGAEPMNDEDTLAALKTRMKKFITEDRYRSTRQYYIVGRNPRISDYDLRPEGVTVEMLQDVARLPDGRSFFPDDLTIDKMDLQVRRDFYDEMKQRKPADIHIAPTGEVTDAAGPASEKSLIQRHREEACKSRGVQQHRH